MIKSHSASLSALLFTGLLFLGGCEFSESESDFEVTEQGTTEEAAATESSAGTTPAAAPAAAADPGGGWRDGRDVGVIPASNNVVQFETLNVGAPTGPNRPGDAEWIISRIEGSGYTRLLIMTMHTSGGIRSPSRIFFQGPGGGMFDGRFPVPLNGVNRWRVEASNGALRIFLNDRQIWNAPGNFGVSRAVMCDSPARGFIGQWRPAQ